MIHVLLIKGFLCAIKQFYQRWAASYKLFAAYVDLITIHILGRFAVKFLF